MDPKLADLIQKKQKRRESTGPVDWDDRRTKYLAAVAALYQLILAELAEPIRDGTIQVQKRPKNLFEQSLGTYSVDDLLVFVGDEQVRFSPRGRNIVGAEGRVDVVGERSEANLILRDGTWFLLEARPPSTRTVRLDGSSLASLFDLVMRG